ALGARGERIDLEDGARDAGLRREGGGRREEGGEEQGDGKGSHRGLLNGSVRPEARKPSKHLRLRRMLIAGQPYSPRTPGTPSPWARRAKSHSRTLLVERAPLQVT